MEILDINSPQSGFKLLVPPLLEIEPALMELLWPHQLIQRLIRAAKPDE